jgi:hypothetical protein
MPPLLYQQCSWHIMGISWHILALYGYIFKGKLQLFLLTAPFIAQIPILQLAQST